MNNYTVEVGIQAKNNEQAEFIGKLLLNSFVRTLGREYLDKDQECAILDEQGDTIFEIKADEVEELNKFNGVVESKAFREAVLTMAKNMGHEDINIKQMYEICDKIANESVIYELIENNVKEYFATK